MKREVIAANIRWPAIIWLAGIINVGAMLPQLVKIWQTKQTAGVSSEMVWIYFLIQICFSLEGFFQRNKMLMWCLGLSALVSLATIISLHIAR